MSAIPNFTKTSRFEPYFYNSYTEPETSKKFVMLKWKEYIQIKDNRSGKIILDVCMVDTIEQRISNVVNACLNDFTLAISILKSIENEHSFDKKKLTFGQNICYANLAKLMKEPNPLFRTHVVKALKINIAYLDSTSSSFQEKSRIDTITGSLEAFKEAAKIDKFKPFSFVEMPECIKTLNKTCISLKKVFMHFYSEHPFHPTVLSEPIIQTLFSTFNFDFALLADLSVNQIMKTYGVKEEDVPKVYSRLYAIWNENLGQIVLDEFPCQCAFDLIKPEFVEAAAAAAPAEQ